MARSRASSASAWRAWGPGTTCTDRSCAACGRCRPPKSARSVLTCAMARTRPGCVFCLTATIWPWWRMPPCQQCRVCRRASTTRALRARRGEPYVPGTVSGWSLKPVTILRAMLAGMRFRLSSPLLGRETRLSVRALPAPTTFLYEQRYSRHDRRRDGGWDR